MNLYTYCHNNPILGIDPSGHFILTAIIVGAVAGAVISGGISLHHEAKSVGGISNMTSDNWKKVGISAGVGGICGAVGGAAGAVGATAAGTLATASAASPLASAAISNTLSYAVGTGMAGGMAGSCASTITQQALYGYSDPYEIMHNTAMGGISGGIASGTLWTASRTFNSLISGRRTWARIDTLTDHFNRHGSDFNARNENHYARMAHRFYVNRNKYQIKTDSRGVTRVYDKNTNSFGSYDKNGKTKTYFKPDKPNYFDNQPGK